jgi:hypothetical protein
VVPVEVLPAGLDPALDVGLGADRRAALHRDVEATHRIDEAAEALEVDEHVVLDVQPGERLDRLGGRHEPRVVGARGELRGVVMAPGVETVEQALVPARPTLRQEACHRRPGPERDVLGLAGEAEEDGPTGLGVDAGQLDAVGAQPLAADAAVAPQQKDVVPAVDGAGRLAVREDRREGGAGRTHVHPRVRRPAGQQDEEHDEGGEQHPAVAPRQAVGAPQPPGVDEEHGPEHREAEQRDLEHGQRPPVGQHGEGGRPAHDREEGDEHRRPHEHRPDPDGEAAEPLVPDRELGRPGDEHGEHEEGDGQPSAAAHLPRCAGVDADGRLRRPALQHRRAAVRSHGC